MGNSEGYTSSYQAMGLCVDPTDSSTKKDPEKLRQFSARLNLAAPTKAPGEEINWGFWLMESLSMQSWYQDLDNDPRHDGAVS